MKQKHWYVIKGVTKEQIEVAELRFDDRFKVVDLKDGKTFVMKNMSCWNAFVTRLEILWYNLMSEGNYRLKRLS